VDVTFFFLENTQLNQNYWTEERSEIFVNVTQNT
jgi:hypothetical protein